jgi:hypothetical protein
MSNTIESGSPISGAVPQAGRQPVDTKIPVKSSQLIAPGDGANLTATSTSTVYNVGLDCSTTTAHTDMPSSSKDAALSAVRVNFLTHPRQKKSCENFRDLRGFDIGLVWKLLSIVRRHPTSCRYSCLAMSPNFPNVCYDFTQQ